MRAKTHKRSPYRWYDPILFYLVIPLLALSIKLLLLSYRLIKVEGKEKEIEALERSEGRAVYGLWHQRIIYHARTYAGRDLTAIISQSRDGEYAARLLRLLGYKNVRGSSSRGGIDALKKMIRKIKDGTNGGMVADGPQGPARVAKIGAVVMARNARVPLIPVSWGTDRYWIFNSWDRFLIPKPFARIVYLYDDPIWIPSSAKGEELERYRKLFEDRLNKITGWCDDQFGEEIPWRKNTGKGDPEFGPLGES